jgi:hypothetical protein
MLRAAGRRSFGNNRHAICISSFILSIPAAKREEIALADEMPTYDPGDPAASECYRRAIRALRDAGVEFLVGGAYAFARYSGIARHTKDFDIFLRHRDRDRALAALSAAGFQTEVTYPHWLGKAFSGEYFIDLITNSGNGIGPLDDGWFEHAPPIEILGELVRLCPPEETLWSKAFIMERNRFDGADVNHVLRAQAGRLDWRRLLERFGPHWRVLLSHLILFGYAYPAERGRIPEWVLRELLERLRAELVEAPPNGRVCRGTLLAAAQYLPDVERWGYQDARLPPHGNLTTEEVAVWTDGVLNGR